MSRAPADCFERVIVAWGAREVSAVLHRTERRKLRIEVRPGGCVNVFVPRDAPYEDVAARCRRKANWIFRELDRISGEPPFTPDRYYLSGETHFLAGRPYRLSIEWSTQSLVRIDGSRLIIGARDPNDAAHCRRILTAFYVLEARSLFPARLDAVFPPFERRGLKRPHLVVRRMAKRWGSYTPRGNITLNVDLVRASPNLIDYVIAHELAHAFYADHGDLWRQLMTSVMSDWQDRKLQLEETLR